MKQIKIKQIDEYNQELLKRLFETLRNDASNQTESIKLVSIERIKSLMKSGLRAYILYWGERITGYALVDVRQTPHIIREFFLTRNRMGNAVKSMNFQKVIECLDQEIQKRNTETENSQEKFETQYSRLKERSQSLRKASPV